MVLAPKNVILLKWPPQHSRLTIRKEGYKFRVLNWIRRISFIKKFIKFYSYFINVINLFNQSCLILQQNWLYIKRKNLCHQQWQQNNVKLACFIAITTLSFLNNWKWKMLYEEQNIRWKHYINVLKLLSLQHNIRPLFALGLLCYYSKDRMYLTYQQQQKTW